jgi:hypothetical protein
MDTSYPFPDYSGFVWFATGRHCVVICAHSDTSFPNRIQFHFAHKHFQFQEELCAISGPTYPSKNGLGTQPRYVQLFSSPVLGRPPQAPRWWKEFDIFYFLFTFVFVFAVLEIKLRTSCLLGRCSTT